MTDRRVTLSATSRKTTLPIGGTIVLWLLLDRLHPFEWVIGACWTLWAILWIIEIVAIVFDLRGDTISAKEILDRLQKLEKTTGVRS